MKRNFSTLAFIWLISILGAVSANEDFFPFDEFQIEGTAFKNGKPAKLNTLAGSRDHPYYSVLNASICKYTYEAIERKFQDISKGWMYCEIKVITNDEVVMGVQLSKGFLEKITLGDFKQYLEEFAEMIKGKTGDRAYFGQIKHVYTGLRIAIKGDVFELGVKTDRTYRDGKSALPFGDLFGYTLCGSTSQALDVNEVLKKAWLFCEVKYVNQGVALVDLMLNETHLEQEKVHFKTGCFADSLKPLLEQFAKEKNKESVQGLVYFGDVMSIASSKYSKTVSKKHINRIDIRIDGRLYENGKPVNYNHDVYEPLSETLCPNTRNAISKNANLTEAWVNCEVRYALGNKVTLGISFCKHYLDKNDVKYFTEEFISEIQRLLKNAEKKPKGYHIGKVTKVYDAANIWVEGNTYKDGQPYNMSRLDGKTSIPPYDLEALNLCKRVELAVTENMALREAYIDCEVKLVKGNQVLTDIWLDKAYLTKMGLDYKSSCFPALVRDYLERYAAMPEKLGKEDIYYGNVELIYGHKYSDEI